MLKQRTWRTIGAVSILSAGAMAWYGSGHITHEVPRPLFLGYWIVFMLLFLVAIYMVLIDLRYIRMQFAIAERDLFLETLAEETLREAIRKGQSEQSETDAANE